MESTDTCLWPMWLFKLDIGCGLIWRRMGPARSTFPRPAMHEWIPHQLSAQKYWKNCSNPTTNHTWSKDWWWWGIIVTCKLHRQWCHLAQLSRSNEIVPVRCTYSSIQIHDSIQCKFTFQYKYFNTNTYSSNNALGRLFYQHFFFSLGVYTAFLAEILEPNRLFSLNIERINFLKVQFLHLTTAPGQGNEMLEREAYMLVFLHKECKLIYISQFLLFEFSDKL